MKRIILVFLLIFTICSFASFAEEEACTANEENKSAVKNEYTVTVDVYAYCFSSSRTATGTTPCYGTIAVDPGLIPLGSKIYVPNYGWGRALDTGGAIKGKKIDIWFPTKQECIKWGVRTLKIKVVPKK
ncbi:MAG: 3D domain-containing protein [Armatimonadota bacterium]